MHDRKYDKELRIGLVLYGGVSLAIYIYGVVYEFLRLVREEGVYAQLIQKIGSKPVIDVISGSSAGGINGLFLAKALTTGADLGPLKDLWIQKGDLETLVNSENNMPLSMLDSNYYETQLREALERITPTSPTAAARRSTNLLDLFITATNLDGIITEYGQPFFRSPIQTKHHNTVFHLQARPGSYDMFEYFDIEDDKELPDETRTHFESMLTMLSSNREACNDFDAQQAATDPDTGHDKNYYLARIAASTSAFPVAFQPVPFKREDIAALGRLFGRNIFRGNLSGLGVRQEETTQPVVYGDGGMVNNKPFSHTIRTIFHRQADGPVDRKLFFIEPDPVSFNESNRYGDRPDVDGFDSLQGFLGAIFYESISADLESLVERNQRILEVRRILVDFEKQLSSFLKGKNNTAEASEGVDQYRQMYQEQPIYGTYRQLKISAIRQELESRFLNKTDISFMITEMEKDPPTSFAEKEDRADREIFVQNWVKERIGLILEESYGTLTTEENISSFLQRFDYHFRVRRLRYFITKINQWMTELELIPGLDKTSLEIVQLNETFGMIKGKLYTFIEFYNHGTWQVWDQARPIQKEHDIKRAYDLVCSGYDRIMSKGYKNLAFEMIGDELADAVQQLRALRPQRPFPPQYEEYYAIVETTAYLEEMLSNCDDNLGGDTPAAVAKDKHGSAKCMEQVFKTYEFLDMYLYPASLLANVGEADPIEVIRVSPKDATRYRNTVQDKLAGEKLMHFSAFLKRSWRENDLIWGRLDAAEIIVKSLIPDDEQTANQILDVLCPVIIKEELTSIRERRGLEINQALFNEDEQTQLQGILDEYSTFKSAPDTEDYFKMNYTPGLEDIAQIGQNYLLRTAAKILRTISYMFDRRSTGHGSLFSLGKPLQYLTAMLNIPHIFLVTLGGSEESRRKQLFNYTFIITVLMLGLHLIGGLALQPWLLLGALIFLMFYLRPRNLIAVVIVIIAGLIALLMSGIVNVCVQSSFLENPLCWFDLQ